MDLFPIHIGLDLVILAVVAGFGIYGLRSFLVLLRYKELKDVGYLWLPGLASGFFFFLWSVEDLFFETSNMGIGMIVTNATLLVAVLLFSLGVLRFSRTWLEYARKRDEALREKRAF